MIEGIGPAANQKEDSPVSIGTEQQEEGASKRRERTNQSAGHCYVGQLEGVAGNCNKTDAVEATYLEFIPEYDLTSG